MAGNLGIACASSGAVVPGAAATQVWLKLLPAPPGAVLCPKPLRGGHGSLTQARSGLPLELRAERSLRASRLPTAMPGYSWGPDETPRTAAVQTARDRQRRLGLWVGVSLLVATLFTAVLIVNHSSGAWGGAWGGGVGVCGGAAPAAAAPAGRLATAAYR